LFAVCSAGLLAGCAHPAVVAGTLPANPYGYLKPAAVCTTSPVKLPASGRVNASMTLSNDGGYCLLDVAQSDGSGQFASFLVTRVPAHGSPLLYNYNGQSRITYTPTGGYLGPDTMSVELVPGAGRPRVSIDVAITVSNAPVSGARS
jgi:hypothetical protein